MATFSTSHTCHMWRISDFSTSVMWRHLKFLHMWRNFQFPHNCHTWKAENSPNNNFFSTNNISDISYKYEVWLWPWLTQEKMWRITECFERVPKYFKSTPTCIISRFLSSGVHNLSQNEWFGWFQCFSVFGDFFAWNPMYAVVMHNV